MEKQHGQHSRLYRTRCHSIHVCTYVDHAVLRSIVYSPLSPDSINYTTLWAFCKPLSVTYLNFFRALQSATLVRPQQLPFARFLRYLPYTRKTFNFSPIKKKSSPKESSLIIVFKGMALYLWPN